MLSCGSNSRISGNNETPDATGVSQDHSKFKLFFPSEFAFIPKEMPIPTFTEATDTFLAIHGGAVNAAFLYAGKLKQENKSPLDLDRTAAICLYSWEENGISSSLNKALRDAGGAGNATICRQILEPWIKYLRLLSDALNLLPNHRTTKALYRSVNQDLEGCYKSAQGQIIYWPEFTSSSCTTASNAGKKGKKTTLFQVQCPRGKDIKVFNPFGKAEDDVLIMATTKFRVSKVEYTKQDKRALVTLVEVVDEGYPLLNIPAPFATTTTTTTTTGAVPSRNTPSVSPLCEVHGEKFKYACLDCGDRLVCSDCVAVFPCSEHKKKMPLDEGTGKLHEDVEFTMAAIKSTWQQDLQRGLDDMRKRIQEVEHEGQQHLTETAKLFDKYIDMLVGMKNAHLKIIADAVTERSERLHGKCMDIEKVMKEVNSRIEELNSMAARSKESSRNDVERFSTAKRTRDASNKALNAALESSKKISNWNNDEENNKMKIDHNYDVIGKKLQSTIQQLSITIGKLEELSMIQSKSNHSSIDIQMLNEATQDKINPVKLAQLQGPHGICRISMDSVAVSEFSAGKISMLSLSTKSVFHSFGQGILKSPYGICLNNEGQFIVTDSAKNQIFVFNKEDGQLVKSSDPAKISLDYPEGVCFDGKNNRIIVVDSGNHRVLILNENLNAVIETIGSKGWSEGQFNGPAGVAMDSRGRIVVSDWGNHRIQVFEEKDDSKSPRGKTYQFSSTFGKYGDANGEFKNPCLLTIDKDDRIIVCARQNSRIQVFNCEGSFIGVLPKISCVGVCLDGKGRVVCSAGSYDQSIYIFGQ